MTWLKTISVYRESIMLTSVLAEHNSLTSSWLLQMLNSPLLHPSPSNLNQFLIILSVFP